MWCTYLTVYKGTKLPKRYIGSTTIDNVKSGYNGSVKSKAYRSIYEEEQSRNKDLFRTRILNAYETQAEAVSDELRLHIKYNVVRDNCYMNKSLASPNGCFGMSNSGESHPFYGKSHTEETRKKLSESIKEQYANGKVSPFKTIDFSGTSNGFYGKSHTEESKLKMRKPKSYTPKWLCPHCNKAYDAGNLKQHMKRNGYDESAIEQHKIDMGPIVISATN